MTLKPIPIPKPASSPPSQVEAKPSSGFTISRTGKGAGERIMLYGCGGIGKTTLCSLAPEPVWLDLEDSAKHLVVPRVVGVSTYADLSRALQTHDIWRPFRTIVIDTLTAAQRIASDDVVANEKIDGKVPTSIEDFGYSRGYRYTFDRFVRLMGDLDRLVTAGKNVILVAHDTIDRAVNPDGNDFIRNEPDLFNVQTRTCDAMLRDEVTGWCDHIFFVKYDIVVSDKGKAKGGGSRTLYPQESPTFIAKSRLLRDPVPIVEGDPAVWNQLFKEAR